MSTLEDKILGNKTHNYCSSSEESGDENEDSDAGTTKAPQPPNPAPVEPEVNKWEGTSTNTGPKGVIKDWQRFKQIESEKRMQDEREKLEMMKKLTLTVQSALDEEREKALQEDQELDELLDDEFLVTYQKQRIQEMMRQTRPNSTFGKLYNLTNGQDFLDAIDQENPAVTIIMHIYEQNVDACSIMNKCFAKLCKVYDYVKFCSMIGSMAGISKQFRKGGVPAILVYKAGNLIGNFVKVTNDIGDQFEPEDVQSFLVEHGILDDASLVIKNDNHSDSE